MSSTDAAELVQDGTMDSARASMRAAVLRALEERRSMPRPPLSNENLLINELIREYLLFNGYRPLLYSLISYFVESGRRSEGSAERTTALSSGTVSGSVLRPSPAAPPPQQPASQVAPRTATAPLADASASSKASRVAADAADPLAAEPSSRPLGGSLFTERR